jgi:hypothetical protein
MLASARDKITQAIARNRAILTGFSFLRVSRALLNIAGFQVKRRTGNPITQHGAFVSLVCC